LWFYYLKSLQLLLSVRDVSDDLVALSLNALATLVPLLGGDVVIGSERHQLFGRGQPKVCYTSEYLSVIFRKYVRSRNIRVARQIIVLRLHQCSGKRGKCKTMIVFRLMLLTLRAKFILSAQLIQ
jgi:hypothetical protein